MLTFDDLILLLTWLVSVAFAAFILSSVANFFPNFIGSVVRQVRFPLKYDKIPSVKGAKKNHGRILPFFTKR